MTCEVSMKEADGVCQSLNMTSYYDFKFSVVCVLYSRLRFSSGIWPFGNVATLELELQHKSHQFLENVWRAMFYEGAKQLNNFQLNIHTINMKIKTRQFKIQRTWIVLFVKYARRIFWKRHPSTVPELLAAVNDHPENRGYI